jgi:hypothetical protein
MNAIPSSPPVQSNKAIEILDEQFTVRRVAIDDDKVTGRQIAEAAGFNSTDELIVLQQLKTGALEEIRPEELVDLRLAGIERFFVIEGDVTYRFILDGLKFEWPRNLVNAASLRQLARKTDVDVICELESAPDRVLSETDVIDLKHAGTERFKTKKRPATVRVYYAEIQYDLPNRPHTTEELLALFNVEAGYLLDLIDHGRLIELKPGQIVQLQDEMHFVSHPPRGQSS